MKLEPKAKPIKIRIMSGGEEHSSLDSLKRNFSVEDLKLLLDGRLSRWLEQQDKKGLADAIRVYTDNHPCPDRDMWEFTKLFFSEEVENNNIQNMEELVNYWFDNRTEYLKNVYRNLRYAPNIAKSLYNQPVDKSDMSIDWCELANEYPEDAELQYDTGMILFEGRGRAKDVPLARKFMELASKMNYYNAEQMLNIMNTRFWNVDKGKIREWCAAHLSQSDNKYFDIASNENEKALLDFVRKCYMIEKELLVSGEWCYSISRLMEEFENIVETDMYYDEKMAVLFWLYKKRGVKGVALDKANFVFEKCPKLAEIGSANPYYWQKIKAIKNLVLQDDYE